MSTRLANSLDKRAHALLVLPGIAVLALIVLYPVGYNLWNSFTNRNLQFPVTSWVGWENYARVIADPSFYDAIGKTLIWTLVSVAGQLALGLIAAIALQNIRRGQTAFRVGLIAPWAFPSIVLAFSWKFMLDPQYGILNDVLMRIGLIDQPVAWLSGETAAMVSVIAMNIWYGFPFMMVALLAGMQSIPSELHESARVDGAGFWNELFHVTLPSLRALIGSLVVLRTIWVFNNFDFIYLTTGGGPSDATQTLPLYAFEIGWSNFNVGRMGAVSVVTLIILAIITAVYLRLFRTQKS